MLPPWDYADLPATAIDMRATGGIRAWSVFPCRFATATGVGGSVSHRGESTAGCCCRPGSGARTIVLSWRSRAQICCIFYHCSRGSRTLVRDEGHTAGAAGIRAGDSCTEMLRPRRTTDTPLPQPPRPPPRRPTPTTTPPTTCGGHSLGSPRPRRGRPPSSSHRRASSRGGMAGHRRQQGGPASTCAWARSHACAMSPTRRRSCSWPPQQRRRQRRR